MNVLHGICSKVFVMCFRLALVCIPLMCVDSCECGLYRQIQLQCVRLMVKIFNTSAYLCHPVGITKGILYKIAV